jgi:hypothetical protein
LASKPLAIPGDEALEAIRNSVEVPAPNFVLDTSPGKHQVVWKVSGFSQVEAESLLHSLADQFGGDPAATDSTRVLRLPGFANHKLPEAFIVQARQESDAVYTRRNFTIDEDSPETSRHVGGYQQRDRRVSNDHKSQSGHDWAFAKRALARGDDPEIVVQRITDHRADDKGKLILAERGDYIDPFATLLFSVTSFVKPVFSVV